MLYAKKGDIVQFCLTDYVYGEIPFTFGEVYEDIGEYDDIELVSTENRDKDRFNIVTSKVPLENAIKAYISEWEKIEYKNRPKSMLVVYEEET